MANDPYDADGDLRQAESTIETRNRLLYLTGLYIAGGVLGLALWMASEVFEGETLAFDEAVRRSVHSIASPLITSFFIGISFLGSPGFLIGLGVIVIGLFLYFGWKRAELLFLVTMAGEIVLDLILKNTYARPRPEPFFDYVLPSSFSFPSGHALGSFCFYGILAWIITSRINNTALIWSIRAAAAVLVLLIGVSRIYLGVHYPTDVLAGFITGLIWTLTVITVNSYFEPPQRETA